MLESAQYADNTFMTLTYADTALPLTASGLPTLAPEHLRNFFKRLRKTTTQKLRYYAVGEYGDENFRPHYHAAVFNFSNCVRGQTGLGLIKSTFSECCDTCRLVGKTWGYGNIYLGALETSSAQYVAGYVTKKLTHRNDPRLRGREPEFARMSNRPGIAHSSLHEIASELMRFNLDTTQGDVPVALRHGSRLMPLGRYLTRNLRLLIGKDEKTPQHILEKLNAELLPVQQAAFDASQNYQTALKESRSQILKNFNARQALKRKDRKL